MTLNVMDLLPAHTPAYMADAWLGCIHWAIGDPDTLAAFTAVTGKTWAPPRNGLDAMIDKATGNEAEFVRAFVLWANDNVWGDPNVTDAE